MHIFGTHDDATRWRSSPRWRGAPGRSRSWPTGTSATSCRSAAWPRTTTRSRSWASASTSPAATRPSAPTARWPTWATPAPGRRDAQQLADEIAEQVSFGVGRKNLADDAPDRPPAVRGSGVGRGAAQAPPGAAGEGAPAARHGGERQPLRGRVRRRDGHAVGRRALREPRLRPHRGVELPRRSARAPPGASGCRRPRCC